MSWHMSILTQDMKDKQRLEDLAMNDEALREEALLAGDLERERRKQEGLIYQQRLQETAALERAYFDRMGWGI